MVTAIEGGLKRQTAPRDRLNIISIIFLINGIGTLLPWNMLINADKYFNIKLNTTDGDPVVENYQANFLSYLGIASKAPNILLQILNMFINAESANLSQRISFTLVIQILIFLFIISLAMVETATWPAIFFWLTMLSAVLINLANGVYQGCVYGLAARFPMKYTNSVTIGMNISGTLASVLMIISIAVSPNIKIEAIFFFSCAVVLLFVCLVSEYFVHKNIFYRFYSSHETKELSNGINHIEMMASCPSCFEEGNNNNNCPHLGRAIAKTVTYNGKPSSLNNEFVMSTYKRYLYILRRIWLQLLNIILIYMVSLSLFPNVEARIQSTDHLLNENYFSPVFCFLFFNFFATVGNFIAQYVQWPGPRFVIFFTLARIAFIPFFLFCNYIPRDQRSLPVIFHRDWMFIAGAIGMATSSGYLSSLCMMYTPRCVPPKFAATAGMLAALTIILGILLGMNFALVYPLMVQ